MHKHMYSDTTQILLNKIVKYAGFIYDPGLLKGRMGIVILLYHASRNIGFKEFELIADTLIEDIVEEIGQSYNNGMCDIAFGFNHLIINGYIEVDDDFFDDFDTILFQSGPTNKIHINDYSLLGLYILFRYENSCNQNFWIEQANKYCNTIWELIEADALSFIKNPELLTPYWYCLEKWSKYNFPFIPQNDIIEKVSKFFLENCCKNLKSVRTTYAIQFFNKFWQSEKVFQFPENLTIRDINYIYISSLLYKGMELPSYELLDKVIRRLVADKRLLHELLMITNYQNLGISEYFSGFAWALIQHGKYFINTNND